MSVPVDLPVPRVTGRRFTAEQLAAIDRRDGRVALAAAAGSGKTSVLVERFVRMVLEDGVELPRILAVTFTERAAAELRRRVRAAFDEHGRPDVGREVERAAISTIHGFCARVLREHAVEAGLDPGFAVLDDPTSRELLARAYDLALEAFMAGESDEALAFVAAHRGDTLQSTIADAHATLRAAGRTPALPRRERGPYPQDLRDGLAGACAAALAEMRVAAPGVRRDQAIDRVQACVLLLERLAPGADPDLGALAGLGFGQASAAVQGDAVTAYLAALERFQAACRDRLAVAELELTDALLRRFDAAYEAAKRDRGALDFTDLELCTRDLLASSEGVRALLAGRFDRIMVDEFQDTNHLQLALLDLLGAEQRFVVGDARQSIYGFRHADVRIFEHELAELEPVGGALRLTENFRSRPEIVDAVNAALPAGEPPMRAARPPAGEPRVELIVVDEDVAWEHDPLLPDTEAQGFHKQAEARVVAARIAELVRQGPYGAGDVVVLLRATTDMTIFQRAIERHDLATLAAGARGFWSDRQVGELCAYLAALANPVDETALLTVLASPLGASASADALALLGLAREHGERPLWRTLADGDVDRWGAALPTAERGRIAAFAQRFARERERAPRLPLDVLLERVIAATGYDEVVLRLPAGEQRLANVNKLIDLAAGFEVRHGRDARAFADRVTAEIGAEARESDAPVELSGVDAVRLMTIHAAKGLQFPVVVVADLGRTPRPGGSALLVEGDRVGIRVMPMHGKSIPAFDHEALSAEARAATDAEERRLYHVAMTRAEEHLILSGCCRASSPGASRPIAWLRTELERAGVETAVMTPEVELRRFGAPPAPAHVREVAPEDLLPARTGAPSTGGGRVERSHPVDAGPPPEGIVGPAAVATVSYSSLADHARCGYRFYLKRVLGLPDKEPPGPAAEQVPGLDPLVRGSLVHALLERLPLEGAEPPGAEEIAAHAADYGARLSTEQLDDVRGLLAAALGSPVMARVRAAGAVRREQAFALALPGERAPILNGFVDLLAHEADGTALIVDYKTDRIGDLDPEAHVAADYEVQRHVYALAALRAGARRAEVVHLFLERPDQPAVASYDAAEADALEAGILDRAHGIMAGEFPVTDEPHRELCATCPGRGGLCSWAEDRVLRPLDPGAAAR